MANDRPVLNQLNLVVRDIDAALAFYRQLGVATPEDAPASPEGIRHAELVMPNGLQLDLDNVALARVYNASWRQGVEGAKVVIGFSLPSRQAVDERYAALTTAGYAGRQPPYDAFWGARYAIVEDPDGNQVGLMSPPEPTSKVWPPADSPESRVSGHHHE